MRQEDGRRGDQHNILFSPKINIQYHSLINSTITINLLKGVIIKNCVCIGFEKYVHTIVKVCELNSAHANLESVIFSKLWYFSLQNVELYASRCMWCVDLEQGLQGSTCSSRNWESC